MFCNKCRQEKNKEAFYIYVNSRTISPCKECRKISYQTNRKRLIEYGKKYYQCNKDAIHKTRKINHSRPKIHLSRSISRGIWTSIARKRGERWEKLVGYTIADLKKHLESQFQLGMTWDNYGEWHIDHIIPVSAFNFSESYHIDFKKCWALENLQPLWAKDNLQKSNKVLNHFQPSLTLKIIA